MLCRRDQVPSPSPTPVSQSTTMNPWESCALEVGLAASIDGTLEKLSGETIILIRLTVPIHTERQDKRGASGTMHRNIYNF